MRASYSAAAALAATFSIATAANNIPKCDPSNPCPAETPCCSQYGQCGVGAYCLGGCDPMSSFDLQSCVAAPMCKSEDYKLTSLDGITPNTDYLGDYSSTNWVSSGTAVAYKDEAVLLTMAPDTVGTLLMSSHYVWYGKISATMHTSQGAGVVTAFILMSDVKDEIDFEFIGVDLENAQSNFYFQGITDYNNGQNISTTDTVQNEHTYTIDWQPDQITWSIDGKVGRTLKKDDTYNDTTKTYHYPQTPARVQLSLWPAGLSTNGEGTVNWAGGLVDWDNHKAMQNGYYYAMVKDVSVECYDPPSGYQNNGDKVYYYTSTAGMEGDVATGNNDTELASFFASGDDPKKDPNKQSGSGTKTTQSTMTATPETVPGLSGGGNQGISGSEAGSGAAVDGSSDGSSGSTGSGSGSTTGSGSVTFSQGDGMDGTGNGGTSQASQVVAGSAVALLGFFAAALML